MFRKILYPTDFSDVSKSALDYIKQLKESNVEKMLLGSVSEKVIRKCKKSVLVIK